MKRTTAFRPVVSRKIRHSNPAYAKASAGSPAIHPRDKSRGILATENKLRKLTPSRLKSEAPPKFERSF